MSSGRLGRFQLQRAAVVATLLFAAQCTLNNEIFQVAVKISRISGEQQRNCSSATQQQQQQCVETANSRQQVVVVFWLPCCCCCCCCRFYWQHKYNSDFNSTFLIVKPVKIICYANILLHWFRWICHQSWEFVIRQTAWDLPSFTICDFWITVNSWTVMTHCRKLRWKI